MNKFLKILRYFRYKLIEEPKYKELKERSYNKLVSVGKQTYGIGPDNFIFFGEYDTKVIIGKYCSIASGVKFLCGGEHDYTRVSTFPFSKKMDIPLVKKESFTKGDIIVGNDVWIGTEAIILSGVKIGNGAVIAARSVVVKDVPDYAIVGGNPAKVIKKRFDDWQIKELLKIQWWDMEEEFIKNNIEFFYGDVNEFIKIFGKEKKSR